MADKFLQLLAAALLITMPLWAGYALDIDRTGPTIHQVDR